MIARPDFDAATFLRTLSSLPGVYRMLDAEGTVLYVGKARNLKRRVASYFRAAEQLDAKTRVMMSRMRSVEVTVTHTETEALLLENNLIKAHRPRYNVLLRDDKSFPYIHFNTEHPFPRIAFHRGARRAGRYFGPYPSAGAVRESIALVQKLFRLRTCQESFFRNRSRPCLQYQIQRCSAPCVGLVDARRYAEDTRHAMMFLEGKGAAMIEELAARMNSAAEELDYEAAARYRDQISSLRRVQEHQHVSGVGRDTDIVGVASREGQAIVQVFMVRVGQSLGNKTLHPVHPGEASPAEVLAACLPQYYLAKTSAREIPRDIVLPEAIPDQETLAAVLSERAGHRVRIAHRVRGERARWQATAAKNAELALAQRLAELDNTHSRLAALQAVLELDTPIARIECFDISHTRGEATVASCVVFGEDGPRKSDYRRYNIVDIPPGDDYAAMHQALTRRYARVQREAGKVPDLVLIDGGRGQVRQARKALTELAMVSVPILGIAKGESRKPGLETLILDERTKPLQLPRAHPALLVLQQVRDEAHRFAISGHRQRRSKARSTSPLEGLPGVGAKLRKRLLVEFGGLQALARAGTEDLARVRGISKGLAQTIYDRFHESG